MIKINTQSRWLAAMLLLVAAMVVPTKMWAEEIRPTKPSVGDGSIENPYQISNADELYWFAALVIGDKSVSEITIANPKSCAKLMNDITVNEGVLDASGNLNSGKPFIEWTPIGNQMPYSGTFDGQGHTVSGLYLDNTGTSYVGLFGINCGTIQNVGVVDSYFNGEDYVGGVCGMNLHDGTEGIMSVTISNCYNTGAVNGRRYVGGVCGYNKIRTGDDGKQVLITDCYNTGKVSGYIGVGGVCGKNYPMVDDGYSSTSIMNCYNTGAVSGDYYVGGVCGDNSYDTYIETPPSVTIMNCYYNSDNYTGNAVGHNTGDVVNVMGKTTAEFASGEVAYLLNEGKAFGTQVWGQQLGVNDYPVLGSAYKVLMAAQDGLEGSIYWATFSNQTSDADLGDLTIYKAKVNNGKMTLTECDNTVAKGEGVLIKGSSKYLNAKLLNTSTEVPEADNDLVATPATAQIVTADDDYTLYRLTYNDVNNKEAIGFYLSLVKDANGDVIESSVGKQLKAIPGKAYLNVPTSESKLPTSAAPARGFAFPGDNGTTGIECITVTDENLHRNGYAEGIFDLQGRKVIKPTDGVYIINGKKVIIK